MPRQGRQDKTESDERDDLIERWCANIWRYKAREIAERAITNVVDAGYREVLTIDARFRLELLWYGACTVLDMILAESEQGNTDFLATEFLAKEWVTYRFAEVGREIVEPALNDPHRRARTASPSTKIALIFKGMDEMTRLVSQTYGQGFNVSDQLSLAVFADEEGP